MFLRFIPPMPPPPPPFIPNNNQYQGEYSTGIVLAGIGVILLAIAFGLFLGWLASR